MDGDTNPSMNTSQQIKHVFGCTGPFMHLSPGFAILQTTQGLTCQHCGATMIDVTNTPVGKAYFAHARPDLWRSK